VIGADIGFEIEHFLSGQRHLVKVVYQNSKGILRYRSTRAAEGNPLGDIQTLAVFPCPDLMVHRQFPLAVADCIDIGIAGALSGIGAISAEISAMGPG
jgi:hypothetical protein